MDMSRRQKRVSSLIREELSRLLLELFQDNSSGIITITSIDVTKDLKTAYVYISLYGCKEKTKIFDLLEKRKGFLRKSIASRTKLKYNPLLIFSPDPTQDYEEKIEKIIENIKKNGK